GQLAELLEGVVDLLLLRELIVESSQDTTCQRDVTRFHVHATSRCKSFHDRLQRIRGQKWGLVGTGVNDLGHKAVSPCFHFVFGEPLKSLDFYRATQLT